MSTTQETTWRAGRFWWDHPSGRAGSARADSHPLRALIFDLDALSDVECDGRRVVFNAAFAAHGLDIEWSKARYRQLLVLADERQRVTAELRRRGIQSESDVLCAQLAEEICATATRLFGEMILDADLCPRAGLIDLIMDAYATGTDVAVVTGGRRRWAEPLVRQLVGEGLAATVVTADDLDESDPDFDSGFGPGAFRLALWELGVSPEDAVVVTGSVAGVRGATAAGLTTTVVAADEVGSRLPTITECRRLHGSWWAQRAASAA